MWLRYAFKLAAYNPEQLKEHLRTAKVPESIISLVFDEKNIPTKQRKWFALKLKDFVAGMDEREQSRALDAIAHDIILVKDWSYFMSGTKGFNLFQYKKFEDAVSAARKWHEDLAKSQEGHPLLYTQPDLDAFPLGNGYKMVRVCYEDMDNEGNLMGHCVGSGAYDEGVLDGTIQIWSLRDKDNYPHATIELSSKEDITEYSADDFYEEAYMETENDYDNEEDRQKAAWLLAEEMATDASERAIEELRTSDMWAFVLKQIQGKENSPIIEKYRPMVYTWISKKYKEGLEIHNYDMFSITPSTILIQNILDEPSSFLSIIEHIDEEYLPKLIYELMSSDKYQQIKSGQSNISGVEAIMRLYKMCIDYTLPNEFQEKIENYIYNDIVNNEAVYSEYDLEFILRKTYRTNKTITEKLLNYLEQSNINEYRYAAVVFKLSQINPSTRQAYSETEEGIQYAAEQLTQIENPNTVRRILGIYGFHNAHSHALPREITRILPIVFANMEANLRKIPSDQPMYMESAMIGEIFYLLALNAPQYIPQLIDKISLRYPQACRENMIKTLHILKIHRPELYIDTLKKMNQDILYGMIQPGTDSYLGSRLYDTEIKKDMELLQQGLPITETTEPRQGIYRHMLEEYKPANTPPHGDFDEEMEISPIMNDLENPEFGWK
jgi:hypothetical protein